MPNVTMDNSVMAMTEAAMHLTITEGQLSARNQRASKKTKKQGTDQVRIDKEDELPKAKEVWRWVKTLVSEHIVLKE